MLMRPGRRMGRAPLLRAAATTAVVAGTATAVSGGVRRHQDAKANQAAEAQAYEQEQAAQQQAYAQQQYAPPPPAPPPAAAPAGDDLVTQLNELAQLKAQGVLSDAEFDAAKAKLLA